MKSVSEIMNEFNALEVQQAELENEMLQVCAGYHLISISNSFELSGFVAVESGDCGMQ